MIKMVEFIAKINGAINNVVWGVPALTLLIGTGILMTLLSKFFQFFHFGHTIKETVGGMFKNKDILKNEREGQVSQFQAMCTALSATIGTGNIAGIALAITMGGPGAIFWMWIAAIVGMMTNYSENVLGIFFRRRNKDGEWCGGSMYFLQDGLGAYKGCKYIGKILAILFSIFALFASFGIGNMGQVGSIKDSVRTLIPNMDPTAFSLMIGGLLKGLEVEGGDVAKAFRYGVAAGAASVMTEGTQLIRPEDFEKLLNQVKIQEV
jgi:AGCS family alanine or glycine:cation symporter